MTKPIDPPGALRPVEAIRADLGHAHTAALTALHSTTIGDGPIGRLLRDVEPLLEAREARTIFVSEKSVAFIDVATKLAAVEAVIEEARKVSPSASMVCYVADLERALGRDAARPHKIGGGAS